MLGLWFEPRISHLFTSTDEFLVIRQFDKKNKLKFDNDEYIWYYGKFVRIVAKSP
jgi:hypothetical protein